MSEAQHLGQPTEPPHPRGLVSTAFEQGRPEAQGIRAVSHHGGSADSRTEDPHLGAQIGDVRAMKILKDRVVLTSGEVAIEVRLAGPR